MPVKPVNITINASYLMLQLTEMNLFGVLSCYFTNDHIENLFVHVTLTALQSRLCLLL